jgi:predicted GTPase
MSRFDADAMRRYEETRDAACADLDALAALLSGEEAASVRAARERLARGKFVLAVIGEFSSGKSFLLNALLGKFRYERTGAGSRLGGLLATDINPSTAAITEIEYAAADEAEALYEGGRVERIPLDALNRFIAVGSQDAGRLHEATKDDEGGAPMRVRVRTNSAFLERGFVLADTPGLASINPAHRRATLNFLPTADAVLYLIDTQQPFSEGDAAFLGIVRRHIDSIFIVQTKIDLWRDPELDGRSAWEHAHERIAQLAAVHAPGTYVYALSAREYAEGVLDADPDRVAASRFPLFLAALDASLISRTGRARLRRTRDAAEAACSDATAQIDADRAMLALEAPELAARRLALLPELDALDARIASRRAALGTLARERQTAIAAQGRSLEDDLEQSLLAAFDTADVAKLRDRARLHILVDRTTAATVAAFAASVAERTVAEIQPILDDARDFTLRFSLNDAAARAFDAEPGTSLWNGDVGAAITSTIVLDAIGGPSVALVHDISSRFARGVTGAYMKRELTADLRAEIFPKVRVEVSAFAQAQCARIARLYEALDAALASAATSVRESRLGSIDRALVARENGAAERSCTELGELRVRLERAAGAIDDRVTGFLAHDDEIEAADPGPSEIRAAHADLALDRVLYDSGLRPQRWRVAVLGALRRGKSSIINAFADAPVLDDAAAGSAAFPIHVRYGALDQAFVLREHGEWSEIPVGETIARAAIAPVLRLTPWKHPRELVLVHAPAFDSGAAHAEDINLVAASASNAVICLFSRQLSDRELELYARVAELGKPMLFAHTIADNETPSERRNVVELAATYLRERGIPAARIFTASAHEYAAARQVGRAPAAWNELGALIATVEGQTEAHMARLARLERSTPEAPRAKPAVEHRKAGFFARVFGRGSR